MGSGLISNGNWHRLPDFPSASACVSPSASLRPRSSDGWGPMETCQDCRAPGVAEASRVVERCGEVFSILVGQKIIDIERADPIDGRVEHVVHERAEITRGRTPSAAGCAVPRRPRPPAPAAPGRSSADAEDSVSVVSTLLEWWRRPRWTNRRPSLARVKPSSSAQ
jgi:hypothetical protein